MTQPSDPTAPQSTPPQASPAEQPPTPYPPPGQVPPGYPPYPPPYPYQPPLNTYAILSLVLALAVFPPLGIYFGMKAKQQIAATGERGIELANVGVIVGWVLTGLLGVFVVIWCGMVVMMFGSMTATTL